MKHTALGLALIASILLSSATSSQADGQKIIFNTESIEHKSGTSSKRCQDLCSRKSGPDAASLLSMGWKIVNSSPKRVIGEDYWYVPCNGCEPHGCICIGKEYILQKDDTVQKDEIPNGKIDHQQTGKQAEIYSPKVERTHTDHELLKKENELLKQELISLKNENEKLRIQLKALQDKK